MKVLVPVKRVVVVAVPVEEMKMQWHRYQSDCSYPSGDVYFYNVGNRMGIDNIAFYGDLAGFGHTTGVDLPHEATGIMPSQKWKLRNFREKWFAGETPSVAIGQGALTVTPLRSSAAHFATKASRDAERSLFAGLTSSIAATSCRPS